MNKAEVLKKILAKIDKACKHDIVLAKWFVSCSGFGRHYTNTIYIEKQKSDSEHTYEIEIDLTKDFKEYLAATGD
jgi:hypothetical protein